MLHVYRLAASNIVHYVAFQVHTVLIQGRPYCVDPEPSPVRHVWMSVPPTALLSETSRIRVYFAVLISALAKSAVRACMLTGSPTSLTWYPLPGYHWSALLSSSM